MIQIPIQKISDPQEKLFMKTVIEYTYKAEKQYSPFFTDFYEIIWMKQTLEKYIGKGHLAGFYYLGGYEAAERGILGVCPYEVGEDELPIGCLKIEVKTGIGKALTHRDFLGALLGLGIERDAVGDIILGDFGAYVIMKQSLLDFVRMSLTSIGKYQNISLAEVPFNEIEVLPPRLKVLNATIASLRMDAVIAAGFGLSRAQAAKLIQADKAKCNGINPSVSDLVKEGDHITVRGFGKIRVGSIGGLTKKERQKIVLEKYV